MAVKHELLKLLEKSKGVYLSGERIAESLGVSRAAVWKAIKNKQSLDEFIKGALAYE